MSGSRTSSCCGQWPSCSRILLLWAKASYSHFLARIHSTQSQLAQMTIYTPFASHHSLRRPLFLYRKFKCRQNCTKARKSEGSRFQEYVDQLPPTTLWHSHISRSTIAEEVKNFSLQTWKSNQSHKCSRPKKKWRTSYYWF